MPFGLQPIHLVAIFVVALLIFGPRRLPEMGRGIGRAINEFRRGTQEMTQTFQDELSHPNQDAAGSAPAGVAQTISNRDAAGSAPAQTISNRDAVEAAPLAPAQTIAPQTQAAAGHFCTNCGSPNPGEARFCNKCGSPLPA